MTTFRRKVHDILYEAYVMFYNAKHQPEIFRALQDFDMTAAWLDEGLTLYERARRLDEIQKREYGEQYAATDAVNRTWQRADKLYTFHRKIARRVVRDNRELFMSLQLHEERPEYLRPWLRQAMMFYDNLLAEADVVTAMMARGRISERALIDNQARVQEVRGLDTVQEHEKTEAQRATKTRDEALLALIEKVNDLKSIADIALEGDQELESLFMRPVS